MSDQFDGAGKATSDDASFRAPLIMIVVMLVLVGGLLLVASGALNGPGGRELNTNVNPPLLESAAPET